MTNALTTKAGEFSILDAFLVSLTKVGIDAVVNPFVGGGGNFLSGGLKAAGALVVNKAVGGKLGGTVATAMMVSAADDIVARLLRRNTAKSATAGNISATNDGFGLANQGEGIMAFI